MQFFNQIEVVAEEEKCLWLKDGSIKRETESLIIAEQEQTIRINAIKKKLDKAQAESECRLCGRVYEKLRHIVCGCPMFAQRGYKRTHGWVGRKTHWKICRKIGFDVNER